MSTLPSSGPNTEGVEVVDQTAQSVNNAVETAEVTPTRTRLMPLNYAALATKLMGELRDQERRLDSLQKANQSRTLRIALFGVRNSCKSSLLAAWYLFRDGKSAP